jgi:hypothetical protein
MNIEIEKKDVFDALHRMSANWGVKLQAAELVASTQDDEERILPLWRDSVAELSGLLSPFSEVFDSGDSVVFILDMPTNWKSSCMNNLVAQCKAFLSNALFARWMDAVKPDSAALYRSLNKNFVAAIEHLLSLRTKPERTV